MEALVSLDAKNQNNPSNQPKRSKTAILVKNLPYDTQEDDLMKLFGGIGGDAPERILLPPSRTIAMVEYGHPTDAKRAFKKLAYKRFKHVPIYMEWAPMNATVGKIDANDSSSTVNRDSGSPTVESGQSPQALYQQQQQQQDLSTDRQDDDEDEEVDGPGVSFSIYIKNLNFSTTEAQLQEFFEQHNLPVRAVKIPMKVAASSRSSASTSSSSTPVLLSMGYGFVECPSEAAVRGALQKLQGTVLDGHTLELKRSSKRVAKSSSTKRKPAGSSGKDPTKITVRNVPFQASRKELLQLFGAYGQLKKVRLPKKYDGNHRGFAFVEFLTSQEASNAMDALARTHLYGRHLVLEWAEDKNDMGTLRDKAERDVARPNKRIRFD